MTLDEGHCYIYFLLRSPMEKQVYGSGKAWNTRNFFSNFVATLTELLLQEHVSFVADMLLSSAPSKFRASAFGNLAMTS